MVPAYQDSIAVEAVPSPSASRLDGAVTERGAPAWDLRCNGRIAGLKWFVNHWVSLRDIPGIPRYTLLTDVKRI